MLTELKQEMPKRYAQRWVQTVVTFILSGLGAVIIGAIMGLILTKPLLVFLLRFV